MRDVDSLLLAAGERWRSAQPAPPDVDARILAATRLRRGPANASGVGVIGLVGMGVAASLVIALVVTGFRFERGAGGPRAVASAPASAASAGTATAGCAVTRPEPPFLAPPPYLAVPPVVYASEWFGSSALWTMLDRDGEVWAQSGLPLGPDGLTQKTFWWSADRSPQDDPVPAITVTGTRLDGPGRFEFGPGTNASADFGPAMLVGVVFPTAGCWQVTGRYRDATLSYVVSITED